MTPTALVTTSKLASANGRSSASPSTQVTSTPDASATVAARSSSTGVMSTPVTSAPVKAAGMATLPVPHATSSTFCPSWIFSACTSVGPKPRISRSATSA